jgi:microsomal dipeptidase-like Zn-dependent dipeptidase
MPTMLFFALVSALTSAAPSPSAALGGDYWKDTGTAPDQVWGVADLHAHFFNHLGFGGRVLHGAPAARNGMREALSSCGHNHGEYAGKSTAILPEPTHRTTGYPLFAGWPRYDTIVHQQAYVDWVRRAWEGGVRLVQMDVQNTPFLGTVSHYANWFGLEGDPTPVPRDDASALELQTAAARLFFEGPASEFAAIAHTSDEARRIIESGKMAIVLGIEVESLDNLATEAQLGDDPKARLKELADRLWSSGVRHVIPIHLTRNAFGQPAVFNPTLNVMNRLDTGSFYATTEAFDGGVRFAPNTDFLSFVMGIGAPTPAWARGQAIGAADGLTPSGVLLIEELQRRGFVVDVEHMSEQGVDQTLAVAKKNQMPVISSHAPFRDLSFGTRLERLDGGYQAEALALPFNDDRDGLYGTSDTLKVRADRSRTREQLAALRELGGMVGVQLVSLGVGVQWQPGIPLDCDGSSKGFLQSLAYAEDLLGRDGEVGIASDVGGFAMMPTPRFGVEACPGARGDDVRRAGGRIRAQALAQRNGVRYREPLGPLESWHFERLGTGDDAAFTQTEGERWVRLGAQPRLRSPQLDGAPGLVEARWTALNEGPNEPLSRSFAGRRQFDVNLDGVAHYGMIPDFFQDSANVARAAGADDLVPPLFRSAERYLQMWRRIETRATQLAP